MFQIILKGIRSLISCKKSISLMRFPSKTIFLCIGKLPFWGYSPKTLLLSATLNTDYYTDGKDNRKIDTDNRIVTISQTESVN